MTAVASRVDARITGDVRGQVAVGSHIVQNNVTNGGVVYNLAPGERPKTRRRPPPTLRPRPPRPLLGRDRELAAALADLAGATTVELVGPHGIGKTDLLKSLVHQAPPSTGPDGVVYHQANEPPEDTLQHLYEVFYESDVPFKPTDAQIQLALRDVRAFVALDDVRPDRESVTRILDTLPAANVLMASSTRSLWGSGTSVALKVLPPEAALALMERELGRAIEADEHAAAMAIARALDHRPLALLHATALLGKVALELDQLAHQLRTGSPVDRLAHLLYESLDDDQRKVLALLASLDGNTLPVTHLAAITGVADAPKVIESLLRLGMIQAHSPRYSVTTPTTGDPGGGRDRNEVARAHFIEWVEAHQDEPDVVLEESGAILTILRQAGRDAMWADVLRLGRAVEGPLIVGRRWGAWREVLELELTAARRLGDKAAESWALHQLGTRCLCLDEHVAARATLLEALDIREELGDEEGARVTLHNLGLVSPGRKPAGYRKVLPFLLGLPPTAVLGGLAILLFIAGGVAFSMLRDPPTVEVDRAASSTLSVEPATLQVGDQPVGTAGPPRTVVIVNSGTSAATLERAEVVGAAADAYSLDRGCSEGALAPGTACTLAIVFFPADEGALAASVVLTWRGGDTLSVAVRGTGTRTIDPALTVSPQSVAFGGHAVGRTSAVQPITLTNTGGATLELRRTAVEGPDAGQYAVRSACGTRLAPRASCSIDVTFAPTDPGPAVAALAIATGGADEPVRIPLRGTGVTGPPPPSVTVRVPAPLTVTYGSAVAVGPVTAEPGNGARLSASNLPEGVTFVDDGGGRGRFSGVALGVPRTWDITVRAAAGGDTTAGSFRLTIVPADVTIQWASPLLDLTTGAPAAVNAVVVLPPGNQGDLSKVGVIFDLENVLTGARTSIRPVPVVETTGAVALKLVPGQLPVGAYTVRPRLDPQSPYFRLASPVPTAVVVNTDALGATVYALSDLLNLIKP